MNALVMKTERVIKLCYLHNFIIFVNKKFKGDNALQTLIRVHKRSLHPTS